jgi:prepilin-type N-terminal cleavage/methylation domain-containing protein
MDRSRESGFSLIELLLVVVIIGIIAAIAVPAYQKGKWAAENGAAFGTMRTLASTQVSFYTQKGRFGRLPEINAILGNAAGTVIDTTLVRGTYVFAMPDAETDDTLKTTYRITARRDVSGDVLYLYELTQTGHIVQVFPVGAPVN